MPIGNLFPKARAVVITVINGLFGSSSIVFVVFKQAYENGATWKEIFLWYTLATLFCLFRTFLLMPKGIIPFIIPEDFQIGISSCKKLPIQEKVSGIKLRLFFKKDEDFCSKIRNGLF